MAEELRRPSKRLPLWETVAIFVAIASLWPAYILRWEHPFWRVLSYVMLGVMVVVFVRRMIAFRRFAREAEEEKRKAKEHRGQGRVRLPWEPPDQPKR